jgi:hypothetical protein
MEGALIASGPPIRKVEREGLLDEATHVLEEARMILPGIQALFGFQLIAVFNARFEEDLSNADQIVHLVALVCAAISVAMLMTPAAYHRLAERGQISDRFITLASRLIAFGMVPLAMGIALDVYVVSRLVLHDIVASIAVGAGAGAVLAGFWFVYPHLRAPRRMKPEDGGPAKDARA